MRSIGYLGEAETLVFFSRCLYYIAGISLWLRYGTANKETYWDCANLAVDLDCAADHYCGHGGVRFACLNDSLLISLLSTLIVCLLFLMVYRFRFSHFLFCFVSFPRQRARWKMELLGWMT